MCELSEAGESFVSYGIPSDLPSLNAASSMESVAVSTLHLSTSPQKLIPFKPLWLTLSLNEWCLDVFCKNELIVTYLSFLPKVAGKLHRSRKATRSRRASDKVNLPSTFKAFHHWFVDLFYYWVISNLVRKIASPSLFWSDKWRSLTQYIRAIPLKNVRGRETPPPRKFQTALKKKEGGPQPTIQIWVFFSIGRPPTPSFWFILYW